MKNTFMILIKSPKFLIGLFIIAFIIIFTNAYVLINHADPYNMIGMSFDPPSKGLFFGTDNFGRDSFLELMYGIITSLKVGLIAGSVATIIGLIIGLFSGYLGGLCG